MRKREKKVRSRPAGTMHENSDTSAAPKTTTNGVGSDKKTDSAPPTVRCSSNALMKLKSYVVALRVWSLSASMLPTILGEFASCLVLAPLKSK